MTQSQSRTSNIHDTTRRTIKTGFKQLWHREWLVKKSQKVQWLYPLIMFFIVITLFPLSLGANSELLTHVASPAIWISCLMALVMGVDGIFREDFENGTLAQIIISDTNLALWVFVRLCIHWIFSAGIVTLFCILAMPLFRLSAVTTTIIMFTLIIGTPTLLMILAMASALTLSLKNSSFLVPLIALPLQIPVLIFATGAINLFMVHNDITMLFPVFALLMSASIVTLLITPWLISYILKMAWT